MVDDFKNDLTSINRMPLTALHITSAAEKKKIKRRTKIFLVLDVCIIVNNIAYLWIAPIETNYFSKDSAHQCKARRFMYWSIVSLSVALTSLVLDLFTLKQVNANYVNAITAIIGLFIDLSQLALAITLFVFIKKAMRE